MSETEIELVRRYLELGNQRDWHAAAACWSDDVELVVAFDSPDAGTYRRKEPVGRWFRDWLARFAPGYEMTIEECTANQERTLTTLRHRGVGRMSGVPVEGLFHCMMCVRDGLITRIEIYRDRNPALRAAGLPAAQAAPSRD
jgi:ketosteroid isomerase-like protein